MTDQPRQPAEFVNIALFALVLAAGAVMFVTSPKQAISMTEKRRLAPAPDWSWRSVWSGRTGSALTDYYSDHFEFRDRFLAIADEIKAARGFKTGDYEVVATSGNHAPPATTPGKPDAPSQDAQINNDDGDYDNIRSVIVYKNKAVQISIGSPTTAKRFADVVNAYHQTLGPAVKVYCMAIPVGSDFYLPHAINDGQKRELKNINDLYGDLAPGIVPVDAYRALAQHAQEYTYFRTDHHWTAIGAYYAYRNFAAAAGLTPIASRAMVKHTIPGFMGSLYSYTRSDALKNSVDYVNYFVIPNQTSETVYRGHGKPPAHARVYETTAKGGNAYSVFIGGDYPVTRIVSDVPGTRKILVIKDSYGNAFVPYLAANYHEVWVVDYRSFWGSIAQLVRDNGIGEVLFAHNSYVYNGKLAITRDMKMLQGGDNGAPLSPAR
jgi:hypothetical protein